MLYQKLMTHGKLVIFLSYLEIHVIHEDYTFVSHPNGTTMMFLQLIQIMSDEMMQIAFGMMQTTTL